MTTRIGRNAGNAIAAILLAAGLFGAIQFGWRTYGSFLVFRSAYELGAPATSSIRAWMSLEYIARTYGLQPRELAAAIGMPAETDLTVPIAEIAAERGESNVELIQDVQSIVAKDLHARPEDMPGTNTESGDAFLGDVLSYSYPALALVLLLGAVGAPVPTGFTTLLAGVLASQGSMNWFLASATAVLASVAGDLIGYAIGYFAHAQFIERYGRYFGYAGQAKARIESLFSRWGGTTVLLTRTLVSHLSSVASLLAGVTGYDLAAFLAFATLGRVLWTAAYFGVGYFVGRDIEAASGFLANLTGFVIALGVAVLAARHFRHFGSAALPTQ
ncbi:MAG TPA: DedA family protein [Bauldia sp.]|nr:DedA family protein [Bauldia sp.]